MNYAPYNPWTIGQAPAPARTHSEQLYDLAMFRPKDPTALKERAPLLPALDIAQFLMPSARQVFTHGGASFHVPGWFAQNYVPPVLKEPLSVEQEVERRTDEAFHHYQSGANRGLTYGILYGAAAALAGTWLYNRYF